MKKLLAFLATMLVAWPAISAGPLVSGPSSPKTAYDVRVTFVAGDTTESRAIPVSGYCTARYEQVSGDDASLYAIPSQSTAATSGTLLKAFTTSSSPASPAFTFTANTKWVKAVATDATAGGSTLVIDCAPLVGASGGSGGSFDACRDGSVQGGGYSSDDGRWAWTCGNFNWHGWRDSSQATASYDVTCTGDGTPHTSCIHSGEVRHIGYGLHRIALAAQYTRDGGRVYLPEGLYVDNGAADMQDGTTNSSFPEPYDPGWESRSDFASLGYPTELRMIQLNRGVRLIGEGSPEAITTDQNDSAISDNRPRLIGTWLVDDRGTTYGSSGAAATSGLGVTFGGENGNIKPPNYYRLNVGGNPEFSFCLSTSTTDPRCLKSSTSDAYENATDAPNDANLWGISFATLANFDPGSGNICVPDPDSSLGTSEVDAIGTCSLNRMIRCWDDDDADEPRTTGGCNFGAGGSFGACQSPFTALVADYETAGDDMQLAMDLTECVDNASAATDCASPMGHHIYITDLRVAPGSSISGGSSCAAGAGTNVQVGNAKTTAGTDFSNVMPFRYFYIGGTGSVNKIFPIRRGGMDGRNAGFENIGRMPANWLSRNSTTAAADCLSGSDIDNDDDETNCDTDTLAGFAMSYNNTIGPGNLFFKASQAADVKSATVENYPSGGFNYFIGNRIRTHYRHLVTDWGHGVFAFNHISDMGAYPSTSYGFSACYDGNCRFEDNVLDNNSFSYLFAGITAAQSTEFKRNLSRNNKFGEPAFTVYGTKNFISEDDQFWGHYSAPLLLVSPGQSHTQTPTVKMTGTFANTEVSPIASNATTGGGWAGAFVVVRGNASENTRADNLKSILIDDVDLRTYTTDSCLIWIDDDFYNSGGAGGAADAASLVRESASRITISNSHMTSGSAIGDAKIACTGKAQFVASALDADDTDNWAFELYAPSTLNNFINNVNVPDMLPTITEVGLDADNLPDGTRIRIHDGSSTACAHTSGDLTAGSSIASCVSDPGTSGSSVDGTWTAF